MVYLASQYLLLLPTELFAYINELSLNQSQRYHIGQKYN